MKIVFPKDKRYSKVIITCGYNCEDSCYCDKAKQCKYKSSHRYHNFIVNFHNFFKYKLHIELPHLIYIQKEYKQLSGTKKCPFNKSRHYTCSHCAYSGYDDYGLEEICVNNIRNATPYKATLEINNDWGTTCKFFKKNEWADDYKKEKL